MLTSNFISPYNKLQSPPALNSPLLSLCPKSLALNALMTPSLNDSHNSSNKSMDKTAFHTALTLLEHPNTYVRMLLIYCRDNTIIPYKLVHKLYNLALCTSLCSWIMDFQTNTPRNVETGNHTSSTLILNTDVTGLCDQSSPLHTLYS